MQFENFVIVSLQITVNNNNYDILVLYIPELLINCTVLVYIYLLHMHFILVTVRLWTSF